MERLEVTASSCMPIIVGSSLPHSFLWFIILQFIILIFITRMGPPYNSVDQSPQNYLYIMIISDLIIILHLEVFFVMGIPIPFLL